MNKICDKCGELLILSFAWSMDPYDNIRKNHKQYHCKNGHCSFKEELEHIGEKYEKEIKLYD